MSEESLEEFKTKLKNESKVKYGRKISKGVAERQQKYVSRLKKGRKAVSLKTAESIAKLGGSRLPLRGGRRRSGKVGRPRGPSGKYVIPGKGAVGVYEWREYMKQRRRVQEMAKNQKLAELMKTNPQLARYVIEKQKQGEEVNIPVQTQHISTPQSQGINLGGGWELMKTKVGDQTPRINPTPPQPPINNYRGDYYTEPDFISGRQVLKKRLSGGFGMW